MRILSGITTSGMQGEVHLGNYLGAMRQHIALQNDNEAFYMLANLHAITVPYPPETIRSNVYKVGALYLALGLDPQRCTLFVQSLVPEHAELTWLLNSIATMGEMRRMTQFKDKGGEHNDSVSVGLFDYPVLMAADILLYQTQLVPVGEDQKQHIELTRDLAERFNHRFGQTFTIPEPMIPEEGARIMSLTDPTKKMSKSGDAEGSIGLLDDAETIRQKLKKAVTDSESIIRYDKEKKPAISNLITIYSLVSGKTTQQIEDSEVITGYGGFKDEVAEALIAFLAPVQERYRALISQPEQLDAVLRQGSERARIVAAQTLRQVKDKMGIISSVSR
jgi:tryptophanyl-tRNA synthetase